MHQPLTIVNAGVLNADYISKLIRFRLWDHATETATVITAELRQINHSGSETIINYGIGASQEAVLDPDQPVSIHPPQDYRDVLQLAEFDERV